ncbi:LexA family transcriptional regulator [Gluconobacter oxydans]|uniref:LexA family transcriptional regulator n=1 Tax=Gluconobacter oxydans TaxID=442 RepID=UPI0034644443
MGNSNVSSEEAGLRERVTRLKTAVRNAGGNTAVAARSGVPFSTLNRYLAGRDMKAAAMIALSQACNVSLDWLAFGQDENPEDSLADTPKARTTPAITKPSGEDDTLSVKFFEVEPSAGLGVYPSEWVDAQDFHVSKKFIRQVLGVWSSYIFFVRVQGDSMTPTIRSGETILVDYAPQDIVDGIFMLSLHGRLIVKRLSIKDMHNISVISDNPRYNTFDVPIKKVCWASADPDADLRVVGKVVGRFEMGF